VNGAPQNVSFAIGYALPNNDPRNSFTVSGDPNGANGVPFDDMNMKAIRKLVLGTTGKWTLMAPASDPKCTANCVAPAAHVFHIHVNPFLYQRVGPTGQSEWVWKDTLLMSAGATIHNVYSQYLDFTGKYVLHCHILDHEDLGMMQVVQVLAPGSRP
jgi:FtsP/CotA-like multicopper oxidase with cupredoxin domain